MRMHSRYATYPYLQGSQKQLGLHYCQLLHDAFSQSQPAILQRSTTWPPLADIWKSLAIIRVKVELAEMKDEDSEVTLYEDALLISGERRDDWAHQEGLNYHEA